MKNLFAPAILATLFLSTGTAESSRQMKLGDLQQMCMSSDSANENACKYYIWGVAEGAKIGVKMANDNGHFCMPEDITTSQTEFVVKKAMGEDLMFYPKDRNLPAVSFVTAVIIRTFPCPKAK